MTSSYGTVYAIQQTAVSLAYSIAPLIGGELAELTGFPFLMTFIGILNIMYGPVLIEVFKRSRRPANSDVIQLNTSRGITGNYRALEAFP